MTTKAPNALWGMYAIIKPHLSSMRIGGIVGDTRHVAGGGYHISRDDLKRHGQGGDYSIQAPADKRGSGSNASAIDITLSSSQMVLVSKRLKAAFDKNDDRIEPCREFIGTVDNKHVCGWNRYRTGRRTGWYSSGYSESSHLWHVHISFFRAYCDDKNSVLGVAEVVCGLKAGALGWKGGNNNNEEDELPSVKDVWTEDIIPAPDYAKKANPKNPNWQPQSLLIDACQQAYRANENAEAAVKALAAATAELKGARADVASARADIAALSKKVDDLQSKPIAVTVVGANGVPA